MQTSALMEIAMRVNTERPLVIDDTTTVNPVLIKYRVTHVMVFDTAAATATSTTSSGPWHLRDRRHCSNVNAAVNCSVKWGWWQRWANAVLARSNLITNI